MKNLRNSPNLRNANLAYFPVPWPKTNPEGQQMPGWGWWCLYEELEKGGGGGGGNL